MTIDLTVLLRRTDHSKTILLFGAGSSIPSGGPSSQALVAQLAEKFAIDISQPLTLSDLATIVEARHTRRELVEALADILSRLQPTRGILNLPDFDWAGLYTTNYDELIEKSYARQNKTLQVICSNFDFGLRTDANETHLYKLHGSIGYDISLGHQHRLILTASDYDIASEYREGLYARFTEQLFTNDAIIIGHSLGDPDLRSIIEEAIRVKRHKGAPGKITLFVYEADENQAIIYEARGLDVCFGGIDEFFAEMAKTLAPEKLLPGISDDPLDRARDVYPSTLSVSSARANQTGNLARMFNGSPANYADIMRGWTFERDFADRLETQLADENGKRIAYVLGAAGSGKTTGVRKALTQLVDRGIECWEHINDLPLPANSWSSIDDELRKRNQVGVLLIDDAHERLHEVNTLVEDICTDEKSALKVVLVSSKPNWNPRLKAAAIFSQGDAYELGALSNQEIISLLDILDHRSEVAALVERSFLGFNRAERERRLAERCRSDMFVCLRNIFGSEAFDDIILREYAELTTDYQEVYRRVAGMESAGVRVHRQLVLRTIGIQATQVARYLDDLQGIIEEQTLNVRQGIFAWRIRHGVIADIIAKHKIAHEGEYFMLLEHTIDNLIPSYGIEIASMNDMCDLNKGLGRIHSKERQNVLLRKMISLAPRERVPRHRLITNLISLGEYENASAEIRIFENELRLDGPVQRYKIKLLIERAKRAEGLLQEDRAAMIREAASLAEAGVERFSDDKNLYRVYLEAGVAYLRYEPNRSIFDQAMKRAKSAYENLLDPDLARTIRQFERVAERFTV